MRLVLLSLALLPFLIASHNRRATILFAGDAMQHSAQIEAARQPDGTYSYAECFKPIEEIVRLTDYAVVNLEAPLGGKPYRGYPCFSAPDSYAEALKNSGFDLFLTANNHVLDCRDRGLHRTINMLDSLHIPHIGTYDNINQRSAKLPFIADINGFKVGFLNYTYGTNGFEVTGNAIVDYIDKNVINKDIKSTRQAGAEIICVCVHWGDEYHLIPNEHQKSLAKFLIEQGVDIIFGGHPHVIQPMEVIENPTTGRNTAIFYSLGNFISNMKTRDTRGGALALVTLQRDSNGIAGVKSLAYRTIFTIPGDPGHSNFVVYPTDQAPKGKLTSELNNFVSAAEAIFNKYNKNVDQWPQHKELLDCTPIKQTINFLDAIKQIIPSTPSSDINLTSATYTH